jgi:hypothetical protein
MGTLSTLRENMLSIDYLTGQNRYAAMNKRILSLREGKPVHINLEGVENIDLKMDSVIAECAGYKFTDSSWCDPRKC